jgi:hypothetical protein
LVLGHDDHGNVFVRNRNRSSGLNIDYSCPSERRG